MTEKNEPEDSTLFSINLDADLLDEDYDIFLMKEMLDFLRWNDINEYPNAIQNVPITIPAPDWYLDGYFLNFSEPKVVKTWTS